VFRFVTFIAAVKKISQFTPEVKKSFQFWVIFR